MYPMDTFNVRLTVGRSLSEVLNTVRGPSGLLSLYQGIGASVLCTLPTVGISFAVYEGLKLEWSRQAGLADGEALGQVPTLCCAAAGTFLACTVAWPLNNIRKRMQMQALIEAKVGRPLYRSATHALQTIVAKEGPMGLYVGWLPSISKNVPAMSMQFVAYDTLKQVLSRSQKGLQASATATAPATQQTRQGPPTIQSPPKAPSLHLHCTRQTSCQQLQASHVLHTVSTWPAATEQIPLSSAPGAGKQMKHVILHATSTQLHYCRRAEPRLWGAHGSSCWQTARRLWRRTM
mmetsp:Transcript_556/g.1684  ORF Transcript_556/g.1684 Transcript_556/m.1684 type:complete len:291 (-) Transcript_556:259-1131(-)